MRSVSRIQVRYPDCDVMGIVHHAVYPYWYEIARMDFFTACGFPYTYMAQYGVNPAMVEMTVKYHAPVRYPGTVTVEARASLAAPRKLRLHYAVRMEGQEQVVAEAVSFHIWTGPDMRAYDMEKNLPDMYAALAAAVEPEEN